MGALRNGPTEKIGSLKPNKVLQRTLKLSRMQRFCLRLVRFTPITLILFASACYKSVDVPIDRKLETYTLERGDIIDAVPAIGRFTPISEVSVSTEVSGRIIATFADVNDVVEKGAILAQIDPAPIQANLELAMAEVSLAEVNLASNVIRRDKIRSQYERRVGKRVELGLSGEEVSDLKYDLGLAESEILSSKARLRRATALREEQRLLLEKSKITSPINGVVLKRAITTGSNVNAKLQNPEIFTLSDQDKGLQVECEVSELDIPRIKTGMSVIIVPDAFPDKALAGKVQKIEIAPRGTNGFVTYLVAVEINSQYDFILPGMTAGVEFDGLRRLSVPKMPIEALYYRHEGYAPSVEALEITESEIPNAFLEMPERAAYLNGIELGRFASENKRRIFVLNAETGEVESTGVRILSESSDYVEISFDDVAEGTSIIVSSNK